MKQIDKPSLGLSLSQIAFGTASLHHLPEERERLALLNVAVDAGITHFDTSPYYGFGIAESSLGKLTGDAGRVTVATKVGLYPPGGADQSGSAILTRKLLGKLLPAMSMPLADMTVKMARASLEGSRRRLKRDRIDFVLLHEPDYRLFELDEWQRFLEAEGGRVGAFGVAGEPPSLVPFVGMEGGMVSIVQTRDSATVCEASVLRAMGRRPDITYGHFAACREVGAVDAVQALAKAISQYPDEVVLVSTRKASRIEEIAATSP